MRHIQRVYFLVSRAGISYGYRYQFASTPWFEVFAIDVNIDIDINIDVVDIDQHRCRRYSQYSFTPWISWMRTAIEISIDSVDTSTDLSLEPANDNCYRHQCRYRCQQLVDIGTCLPLEPAKWEFWSMLISISISISASIPSIPVHAYT